MTCSNLLSILSSTDSCTSLADLWHSCEQHKITEENIYKATQWRPILCKQGMALRSKQTCLTFDPSLLICHSQFLCLCRVHAGILTSMPSALLHDAEAHLNRCNTKVSCGLSPDEWVPLTYICSQYPDSTKQIFLTNIAVMFATFYDNAIHADVYEDTAALHQAILQHCPKAVAFARKIEN